jgi:hypothetical protein
MSGRRVVEVRKDSRDDTPSAVVQGGGEGAHDKWDHKIVKSLERELGPDYAVRYPRMPDEADAHYADWKAALTREFARLANDSQTTGGREQQASLTRDERG